MRKCVQCNAEITRSKAGRPARYCSVECGRLYKRKLPVFTHCLYCNTALEVRLVAGQPKRYCNRKCASDLRTKQQAAARRFERPCSRCGTAFVGVSARVKYCSETCRLDRNRELARERWLLKVATRPETKTWVCQWCKGEVVVHISYTGHGKYHPECKRQAARAHNRIKTLRRQSVKTDLRITHEQIAERDNFTCHICRELVDMSLPRTSKFGATIDHVVPITRGGKDELDNLKLAHWTCNIRKHNKLMEELNV